LDSSAFFGAALAVGAALEQAAATRSAALTTVKERNVVRR
jgi:hypothetical protein